MLCSGGKMSPNFREDDDVDREFEENRRTTLWIALFYFVFFSAIWGLLDWLQRRSLKSFWEDIGVVFAVVFVLWLVFPIFEKYRIRTKVIYGKLSAIEDAMDESEERDTELLKMLTVINNRLDEIQGHK
jgi:hypothetical protein